MQVLALRSQSALQLGHHLFFMFLFLFLLYVNMAPAAAANAPLVAVGKAKTAPIVNQVPITGTITSPKVSRLSTQVSGQVKSLKVEVGDRVKKGDVLLHLDDEVEAINLEAARAAVLQAREELADARRRLANARRLRKKNTISVNELQLREAEVKIDEAALQKLAAEERRQQALLKRFTVKAPFNGVVSERMTEVGEWLEPGKSILTLVSTNDLRIDFRVPQEFFSKITPDTRVKVTLDALPGREFQGDIDAVVPVSDPSARTFLMHVVLNNDDVKITPGMSVHGRMRLASGEKGVVISRDALLRYPDGRVTVWVIAKDGDQSVVSEKPVLVGHSFNGLVSIRSGLQAGETVVVEGNESLQNGQSVRIHNKP